MADTLVRVVDGRTVVVPFGSELLTPLVALATEAAATATEKAAEAVATVALFSAAIRSPFQPQATFSGSLEKEQLRGLIIDAAFSSEIYDPAKYYSFAIIDKVETAIELSLYRSASVGADFEAFWAFRLTTAEGYTPDSTEILTVQNQYGRIAFVPAAIPNGYYEGDTYLTAGLSPHLFSQSYGLVAATAGSGVAVVDPVSHLIGNGYVSEYTYLHPSDAEEHVGDSFVAFKGVGQRHYMERGGVIAAVGTSIQNGAGQTFRGTIRVVRMPVGTVDPAAGVLIESFDFPSGYYAEDIVLTLAAPIYFEAGAWLAVYAVADDGFTIGLRYWNTPWAGEPNPTGRSPLLFSDDGTGWSLGFSGADFAYWQTPLRLFSNLVTRSVLDAALAAAPSGLPRLVLPSAVHAIVGLEFNLYYDAIALLPDVGDGPPPLLFDVVCDIGQSHRRSYRVTPTDDMTGDHPLTLLVYNNRGDVIASATTMLVVAAAAGPAATKRILSIGDSTTDDTAEVTQMFQSNLDALTGTTPTFIGTHGIAPYNHEARSGQTFSYYANGADRVRLTVSGFPTPANFWPIWTATAANDTGYLVLSEERSLSSGAGTIVGQVWSQPTGATIEPGWTGQLKMNGDLFDVTLVEVMEDYSILKAEGGVGDLDFAAYIARFGFAGCDLLTIDLGINDSRGPIQSEEVQLAKIESAKAVIDSFIAYNAAGKVMVCLPKSCASTRNVASSQDGYRLNIHRLRELIVEHFDNGAHHANVIVCASGLMMDRYYGYPLIADQAVAARYTETETVHGDQVHPRQAGYHQVADGMTATAAVILA